MRQAVLKLNQASKNKNDEFFTTYSDIEREVEHYWDQLEGKNIWLACNDNPKWSQFYKYFIDQSKKHKFQLATTSYNFIPKDKTGYIKIEVPEFNYRGEILNEIWVDEDFYCEGDFRSDDVLDLWKWCDVIITNPPFSLMTSFIQSIILWEKKFLIVAGHMNIGSPTLFRYFQNNEMRIGYHNLNQLTFFEDETEVTLKSTDKIRNLVKACLWFTNLEVKKELRPIEFVPYDKEKFLKYDNFDAIETVWWYGEKRNHHAQYPLTEKVLGVPITYMYRHNPEHFEIIDLNQQTIMKGEYPFKRIFIKIKHEHYLKMKEKYGFD